MLSIKCHICPESFTSESDAKDHFIESHASNRCQLCERAATAKASHFCPTCKTAFLPELNLIEGLTTEIKKAQKSLLDLTNQREKIYRIVKARLVQEKSKLFCAHNVPKNEPCSGCKAFENREVIKSQKIEKTKTERAEKKAANVIWVDV